ncbi:MAG: S9 family peptidase [Clostridia bacterium]|nr:S9 family peptidase [Clostridia bacterium]
MKKSFTPQDAGRFSYLSWPQLSPNGKLAAVVVKKPEADGVCRPRVRVMETEKGGVVYESPNGVHESQPRFLPDNALALLSDASGENQVWFVTGNGREQKTTLRHGVNHFDTANGSIAFEATLWPEEIQAGTAFQEMRPEEKEAWESQQALRPYVAEDLAYKMDEWFGMRKGEKSTVGLYGPEGAFLLPLDGVEAVLPALSPDGQTVAFFSYPHSGAKGRQAELAVWRKGEPIACPASDQLYLPSQSPVFSEDGNSLWALAYQRFGDGCSQTLIRFDLKEKGAFSYIPDLAEDTCCSGVGEAVVGRTENGENASCFSLLKDRVVFLSAHEGKTKLCSVSPDSPKEIRELALPFKDILGFAMNEKGSLAVLSGTDQAPADLYVDGRRLTDEHAWLSDFAPPETREYTVPSRDGKAELRYYLTLPKDYAPGKAYPAVLDIKGGPETMYADAYWHEFHALSAAGFAVIHGNPRGSAGFGRGFCADGICWKDEAMHDLIDMCLDAVNRGIADRDRIGVTGGSYGGYMTLKLISKTDFFAAAAGQRILANPATSYGTGDMGWISSGGIPERFSMLNYLRNRAKGSSASRVDQIKTPLLLLHGYRDYRCSFEQAEQIFIPLRERHPEVPVRLVMFPKENHALTRTGNMKAQVRHLEEIVDWFKRYLA